MNPTAGALAFVFGFWSGGCWALAFVAPVGPVAVLAVLGTLAGFVACFCCFLLSAQKGRPS